MIKFESYLENNDNKRNKTTIIENQTSSIPIRLGLHSYDSEKGNYVVVSCCIACKLTTGLTPMF